jgi:uncharacterized protein YndB with AHSA1/START domain
MPEVKAKKKNEKVKFSLEFEIKCSPKILFSYLSTASGLEGWFADKVTMNNGDFVFHWGETEQRARVVTKKDNQLIRYHWMNDDKKDDTYFQFEVVQDELTGDVALIITDFTTEEEKQEDTLLWSSEVHELMHMIGS